MEENITVTPVYNPEVIFQQEKAQYDIAIATANKYPRVISRVIESCVVTVTLDEKTAQACNYALPRGGKVLQGPTIHLAKIIMQNYKNFRAETKVIGVDATHVTSRAIAFDLENNVAVSVEVKRSILQNEWNEGRKTGRMQRMNDDMITVTGNAANSIALRNAIFAVIPQAITNHIYEAAKAKITGDISDETKFLQRRTEIFNRLKDNYSINEEEILYAIGKQSISNVTGDDLLALIGYGQAIKDGDSTIDEIFKKKKGNDPEAEKIAAKERRLATLWKSRKKFVPAEEVEDIKRIVEKKETASYDKAIKFLEAIQIPKK